MKMVPLPLGGDHWDIIAYGEIIALDTRHKYSGGSICIVFI